MFLIQSDYDFAILPEYLLQLIEGNHAIRLQAELLAQSTIEDYLRHKFDIETIFAQTNGARDKSIIQVYVHISLYNLFSRVSPVQIPEQRVMNYEQAMKWLKMVVKNEITPDLPKREQFETKSSRFLVATKDDSTNDWIY